MTTFAAIVRQRCPRCFSGSTFRSGITMYEQCPHCGLRFEREQGYFIGAMYIAYAIAVPLLVILTLLVWMVTKGTLGKTVITGGILLAPFTPLIFRYSRVIWLHMDYRMEPW